MYRGIELLIYVKSLSLRRAWIEIWNNEIRSSRIWSLSLRRAWIEIASTNWEEADASSRSPYGERGLKYGF